MKSFIARRVSQWLNLSHLCEPLGRTEGLLETAENTVYTVNLKMLQHENYDISEMRKYFCTKFCPFVYKTTVQKCAASCCIYSACAKLTETQTSGSNFATAQKDDVMKVSLIERPVPPLLRRRCDVII